MSYATSSFHHRQEREVVADGEGKQDTTRSLLRAVAEIIEKGFGYAWDGVCLAVAMPQSTTPYLQKEVEEWEELCTEFGFEYVDVEAVGRNEFGGKRARVMVCWCSMSYNVADGVSRTGGHGTDQGGARGK